MLQILKCILGNVMVIIFAMTVRIKRVIIARKYGMIFMMQYYTSIIIVFYKLKNKHTDSEF